MTILIFQGSDLYFAMGKLSHKLEEVIKAAEKIYDDYPAIIDPLRNWLKRNGIK